MKYVIGSGWWSAEKSQDNRSKLLGDDYIRSSEFHRLWYEAIDKYTNPEKIILIDSCSPNIPPINKSDSRIEYIRLNLNAGHSTDHTGKYCGYTRAILVAMEYTLQCDADYFVYVEQDALVYGNGIIEHCIAKMKKPIMFGSGEGTPQILQQSFFIFDVKAIRRFINRLHSIKERDNIISPEEKFRIAASQWPVSLLLFLHRNSRLKPFRALNWKASRQLINYDHLPIGFGRVRPIEFESSYFYFQHGSKEEVSVYMDLLQRKSSS